MFAVALVLATLTYWLIERPVRFGEKARGIKAIILAGLMILVGGVGGYVFLKEGLAAREAVKNASMLLEDFALPALQDDSCTQRYGSEFGFCKHKNVDGGRTILLLGDSHSLFVFSAIAEYGERQGYNTLLVSEGEGSKNSANGKHANPEITQKLFEFIDADKSIEKVFIVTRGVLYINGRDHDFPASDYGHGGIGKLQFSTQRTLDRLNEMGKTVYLVAENPVWPGMGQGNTPEAIRTLVQAQPFQDFFRPSGKIHKLGKKDVLEHQKEYLKMLSRLSGVTILYTIDAFCPDEKCLLFDGKGFPLYWDDDHLSQHAGGRFLLEKVLKPYLQ
jgi:hypothetical protein